MGEPLAHNGKKLPISVLVAAKNEEVNMRRCLASLGPAQRIYVVDSHSEDATSTVARDCGAEVVQFNDAGGYPRKRQWALETLAIPTKWVLLIDADETVPHALWEEICGAVSQPEAAAAYLIRKAFHFLGRRFRFGGFSHDAVLLFQRGTARFERLGDEVPCQQDMEVHERLIVEGPIARLKTPVMHEDFKGLAAYLEKHNKYSSWEAAVRYYFLKNGTWGPDAIRPRLLGDAQQRRRFLKALAARMPFEPQLWFLYHYVLRLGFLEGRRGLIACQIRRSHICQVRAKLYESQLLDQAGR
jgi:hypothetical protein